MYLHFVCHLAVRSVFALFRSGLGNSGPQHRLFFPVEFSLTLIKYTWVFRITRKIKTAAGDFDQDWC